MREYMLSKTVQVRDDVMAELVKTKPADVPTVNVFMGILIAEGLQKRAQGEIDQTRIQELLTMVGALQVRVTELEASEVKLTEDLKGTEEMLKEALEAPPVAAPAQAVPTTYEVMIRGGEALTGFGKGLIEEVVALRLLVPQGTPLPPTLLDILAK